jgi:probable HAF family extracellular repeat protein
MGNNHAYRWTQPTGMVDLGFLPGGNVSVAQGVSGDGLTVVGVSNATDGQNHAFKWTAAGGMVPVPELPGTTSSQATGASSDGSVIVGTCVVPFANPFFPTTGHAFRWTAAEGTIDLGLFPTGSYPNAVPYAEAFGVSADGTTVVGGASAPNEISILTGTAFSWTEAGGLVNLGYLLPTDVSYSQGNAISSDGSVIAGYATDGLVGSAYPVHATQWTAAGGWLDLEPTPVGNVSFGFAISADGVTIVGSSYFGGTVRHAFMWTAVGGMVQVPERPDVYSSSASGTSSDGSVIVGSTAHDLFGNGVFAFRWTSADGMVNLGTLPGGTTSAAWGVSLDGSVVVGSSDTSLPLQFSAADFFFTPTSGFVDLTQIANRRKFFSASGGAPSLGSDGSAALGTIPAVFLHVSGGGLSTTADTFAQNNGSGGAFAITNGPLMLSSSVPPGIAATAPAGPNVVGDYRNGNLYVFNLDQPLDNGTQRRWLRRWRALAQPDPNPHRFVRLTIQMETGMQVPDGTSPLVELRWSDDGGHLWSNRMIAKAGPPGATAQRVFFTPLGSTRRNTGLDRIFELSSSDPFKIAIMSAELEP